MAVIRIDYSRSKRHGRANSGSTRLTRKAHQVMLAWKERNMADSKQCETCVHWSGGEEYSEALGIVGACNATIETWSATDNDADYNQFLKPECKDTTAFVADGSGYSATLYTRPMHFCSMWKGRATNGVPSTAKTTQPPRN